MKRIYGIILLVSIVLAASCTPEDGIVVRGKVSDASDGKPMKGVVVSDGVSCAETGIGGRYRLVTDRTLPRTVFVVNPEDYEPTFGPRCTFSGWMPVDTSLRVNRCDFSLEPAEGEKYTMLFMGDPQVMSPRPHSLAAWEWVTDRLKEYADTTQGRLYAIYLGDMVVNEIEVEGKADWYLDRLAGTGIKSFHVPGNHDHIQSAGSYAEAIPAYVKHFGPYNYAVNIGKVHYIFLDTMQQWTGEHGNRYEEGVSDEAIRFIGEDLAHVPADRPVMICTHCPMTKQHGGRIPEKAINYDRLISLLAGREVYFWYGHIHFNSFYNYSGEELAEHAPGVKSLESAIVGRVGGSWACSGETGRDGCPRGMVAMEVNPDGLSWRFRSLDVNYPDDMRLIAPGTYAPTEGISEGELLCNVYAWDGLWSLPEFWIDGKKAADFRHCTCGEYDSVADPEYAYRFPIWKSMGIQGFRNEIPKPYDNNHLFAVLPPEGVSAAEVRVTDRWGNTYCRNIEW